MLALRAGRWHLGGRKLFRGERFGVQAHRGLAGLGRIGTAYFGWILGTSLYTQMATPLTHALAVAGVAVGEPGAVLLGVGMGLARSVPPWRAALSRVPHDPAGIVSRYTGLRAGNGFRLLGVFSAVGVVCLDLVAQ